MTEATSKRFELGSIEWVDALRQYLATGLGDENLDGITAAASFETTNPPAHLLKDGRDAVGWFIRIEGGQVEVGDHPLAEADVHTLADYEAMAESFRISDIEEYSRSLQKKTAEGKMRTTGDRSKAQPISELMMRIDLRDGFYARYTA